MTSVTFVTDPEANAIIVRETWESFNRQKGQICRCGHKRAYHTSLGCHVDDLVDGKKVRCACKAFEKSWEAKA